MVTENLSLKNIENGKLVSAYLDSITSSTKKYYAVDSSKPVNVTVNAGLNTVEVAVTGTANPDVELGVYAIVQAAEIKDFFKGADRGIVAISVDVPTFVSGEVAVEITQYDK